MKKKKNFAWWWWWDALWLRLFCVVCRLLELHARGDNVRLLAKELLPLQNVSPQRCLAFSGDGSRFATGGVVSNICLIAILLFVWSIGLFWKNNLVYSDYFVFLYFVWDPFWNLKDGHLRIFEWPNLRIILDEPRAHKSFQDMDFR